MKVFFIALITRGLSLLPLSACFILGKLLGPLVYWSLPSRRNITERNISACFPERSDQEVKQLSRAHFQHMLIGIMTLSIAWWASARRIEKLVRVRNIKYLESRMKRGENIILLAPHFTNLEILGIWLFSRYRMTAVYKPNRDKRIDGFIRQRRCRFKGRLHKHTGIQRELIKDMRQGIPLYYLPDQDSGNWGVFAPFFGIPTATFGSLGRMAEMAQAVVIPCIATISESGRRIEVLFDVQMQDFPTGNRIEDATSMNRVIEKLIDIAPEQYFWSHKKFKTRPEGEQPFYQ
ncbi:MAG: lysophospholipid acyltransferase family protein [Gammaproteobacteria bacterium]|nr:lysophospholipid acyltransferase family protein [Gammaproteobacteria bacterium]